MKLKKAMGVLGLVLSVGVFPAQSQETADLGKVVVTASRMAQHDYKVASNVTVIDQKKITQSTAKTVNEILQEQIGVNVYDSGTVKTATVDIRGFGDTANRNVLILVNDRKVNSVDNSGADLLQIPLGSVERIEIIRGSGSVLYGDNAVGGVINIITKEGKGALSGRVGTKFGSYGQQGEEAEISGSAKKLSYYFYSQYDNTDGYRDNSQLLAKDFNSRVGYKHSEKAKVSLAANYHKDDYGLPGGLNDTELRTLGRRGSADSGDYASSKDRSVQMTADLTPWPEDLDLGRFVTDVSYRNRDTFALFSAYNMGTKRMIDTYGVTEKYIFNHKFFDRDFNLVAGLDYYDTENDILGSGTNTDNLTIAKKEWGIYFFSEAEIFEKFYLNGGSRLQKADYVFDQQGPTKNYITKNVKEPVSMIGGRYEYAKGSNVFINVQQNFRFLATDEWYSTWTGLNTNLKQQTGIQYEAGVKHNWNDVTTFGVTPYWLELHNEIFFDPKAGGGWGDNSNYGKTRRIGVDVTQTTNLLKLVEIPVLSRCKLLTNYSFERPQFVGGANDDKFIPLAPQHQGGIGMEFEFQQKYRVAFMGRYVGARYAINDTLNETAALKPYWVLDSKVSYARKNFEIFVALNNMLNKEYFSYATKSATSATKDYFPALEFNLTAGMNLQF